MRGILRWKAKARFSCALLIALCQANLLLRHAGATDFCTGKPFSHNFTKTRYKVAVVYDQLSTTNTVGAALTISFLNDTFRQYFDPPMSITGMILDYYNVLPKV